MQSDRQKSGLWLVEPQFAHKARNGSGQKTSLPQTLIFASTCESTTRWQRSTIAAAKAAAETTMELLAESAGGLDISAAEQTIGHHSKFELAQLDDLSRLNWPLLIEERIASKQPRLRLMSWRGSPRMTSKRPRRRLHFAGYGFAAAVSTRVECCPSFRKSEVSSGGKPLPGHMRRRRIGARFGQPVSDANLGRVCAGFATVALPKVPRRGDNLKDRRVRI